MGASSARSPRKPQPRFVHGGGFRNNSHVALDRNLIAASAGWEPDFETTATSSFNPNTTKMSARPTHRFQLPQKNTSTFMSIAHCEPATVAPPRREHTVGKRMGVREFSTKTDYHQPHASHYAHATKVPADHYRTSHKSDFMDRHPKLVVPPGKGGVDVTRATIKLSTGDYPTETTHYASVYTGQQLPRRSK
jgi:hypothetical protein